MQSLKGSARTFVESARVLGLLLGALLDQACNEHLNANPEGFAWGPPQPASGLGGATEHFDCRGKDDSRGPGGALPACGTTELRPSDVQGTSTTSSRQGQSLEVWGRVTLGYTPELGGFFIESRVPDEHSGSSEGVFVYAPDLKLPVGLKQGFIVGVLGEVTEYFGQTELRASAVWECAAEPLSSLDPPRLDPSRLEDFEGMPVQVPELVIQSVNRAGQDGGYGLGELDGGAPVAFGLADPDLWPSELDHVRLPRRGEILPPTTGILTFRYGRFELIPSSQTHLNKASSRPESRLEAPLSGRIRVAFLNLHNWFWSLGARGANDEAERGRQRQKLVSALLGLNADVIGLAEIERDADGRALDELLAALREASLADWARPADPPNVGDDEIRVGLIYRADRVRALGQRASSEEARFARAPIAEVFEWGGRAVLVVVSHLKSRGGCPEAPDPDADYGFGCFNARRTVEAEGLIDFAAGLQLKLPPRTSTILMGDLNADLGEPPLDILEAGYVHAFRDESVISRYSYAHEGRLLLLDHILASAGSGIVSRGIWHINSDESSALDARNERHFSADPFRASDHDPVWVDL